MVILTIKKSTVASNSFPYRVAEGMYLCKEYHKIILDSIINSPVSDKKEYKYSDLGFMLLGRIVEKVSGYSLDDYWRRNIALPLDLDNDLFFASTQKKGFRVYAGTGECHWSKTRLSGVVHDDNCRALGGVAGHAGLFGTAKAVLALCENILLQYKGRRQSPSYSSENLRTALNSSKGNWRFGFDTPSAVLSSSGKYFSDCSAPVTIPFPIATE